MCATKPTEIIKIKPVLEYVIIPDNIMRCNPVPEINPKEIKKEKDYNEKVVGPLYLNNKECYQSMEEIRRYNQELKNRKPE